MNDQRISIDDCEMSIGLYNVLKNCNIHYLDEFLNLETRNILIWKNFGKKRLAEIKTILKIHGLRLKDEPSPHEIKIKYISKLPNKVALLLKSLSRVNHLLEKLQRELIEITWNEEEIEL